MKIMILTGSMGSGGAQTHVFELARSLILRGHRIILVSSGGQTARALARLGAKCFCVDVDPSSTLSVLGGFVALHALILRERPDVIHAHTRPFGLLCRVLRRKLSDMRIAYVSTVHARFATDSPIRRLPWYSGDSIAVSEDLKHYLLAISRGRLLPERITVISNGIDTDRFCPKPRELNDAEFRLCFMSRLDADCSATARLLCEIAPRVCARISGAQIYIIGGGSELDGIRELAKSANLRIGRLAVRVIGNLDAPELILARCDGFVGVSRAALEAMSCGMPIILSGDEGFGGLVRNDEDLKAAASSNFCCRDREKVDADKLLRSILELGSMSCEARDALGQKMRNFITQNNSSDKMAQETERIYSDVLSRARSRHNGTLLCGYYGFGNMGDDALLIEAIERKKSLGVAALTYLPKQAEYKFGVRCADRSDPFAVIREIKRCKTLVFGGGSLLQSRTSFRSLCWYSWVLIYARSKGKRIELIANGIDDLSGVLSRELAALALRCADRIGVRDERSASNVLSLVPERASRIFVESDLALSCHMASEARISYILSRLDLKATDKFAIIAPKGYGGISLLSPSKRKRILSEYRILKSRLNLLQRQNVVPLFIAAYPAQDGYITHRLCKSYGGKELTLVGISDLLSLTSYASAVISMRYHPLLFAKRLNIPYRKIGEDPKITSL